ncbi:hypothetical protein [Streptomyces carpaticus]|uniref:Uncharacterized protein n=1 Tax=Streptomyces carpaticus TaxID=285558 RepID=A0ABV4ZRZ9_9ACTN
MSEDEIRRLLARAAADEPPLRLDLDGLVGRARHERRRRRALTGAVLGTALIAIAGTTLPGLLSPSPPLPAPLPPATAPATATPAPDPGASVPVPLLWPAPEQFSYSAEQYAAVARDIGARLASVPAGTAAGFEVGWVRDDSVYPGSESTLFTWEFALTLADGEQEFEATVRLESLSFGSLEPLACRPAADGPCRVLADAATRFGVPEDDGAARDTAPEALVETAGPVATLERRVSAFQGVTVTVTGDVGVPRPLGDVQMDDIARLLIA